MTMTFLKVSQKLNIEKKFDKIIMMIKKKYNDNKEIQNNNNDQKNNDKNKFIEKCLQNAEMRNMLEI